MWHFIVKLVLKRRKTIENKQKIRNYDKTTYTLDR